MPPQNGDLLPQLLKKFILIIAQQYLVFKARSNFIFKSVSLKTYGGYVSPLLYSCPPN